jgi:type II secretory pathway predicted ATPase ExeA
MFLDFYGLREQPFGVTPDPKYIFWSESHREALASIYYAIESDRGFVTLIAPPGLGKTTLLFQLLERMRESSRTAFLFQTQCNSDELLRYIMADLGCDPGEQDTVSLHGKLNEILIEEVRNGRRFVLFIDEAQNLDEPVLETIRLLSDFETPSRKLMQIVLAGQPQLASTLARREMTQLRQRISIMSQLEPLGSSEVNDYIEHRLRIAGYHGDLPFKKDALAMIVSASQGIPRTINNLCFNALSLGYAKRSKKVNTSIVREVISDLDVPHPSIDENKGSVSPLSPPRPADSASPAVTSHLNLREPSIEEYFRPMGHISPSRVAASAVLFILAGSLSFSYRSVAPMPVPVPAPKQSQYLTVTVGEGETLGSISLKYLGRKLDNDLSEEILKLNKEIKNPNRISSGIALRLPTYPGKQASDKATPGLTKPAGQP